jgi:hypothetical protein
LNHGRDGTSPTTWKRVGERPTVVILLCFVPLSACSRPHAEPRAHTDSLQPPPTKEMALAGCRGSGDDVQLDAPIDTSAPIVVLEEIHLHGEQPPQPTIAIWADGHVVFTRDASERFEHLDGEISTSTAATIARDVFAAIERVPRYTDVDKNHEVAGGQVTMITVRRGDRWRSASVYGAWRDDFLAETGKNTAPKPVSPGVPSAEHLFSTALADVELEREPPPTGFATAYRRVFESLPTSGARFSPYAFDVRFFSPDNTVEAPLPELVWPIDLPTLPHDLRPTHCDPYDTDGCPYVLDPEYRDAAARLRSQLVVNNKVRTVIVNGNRFMVVFDALYRGQHSIDAVVECARQLARRAHTARRER